MAGADSKKKTPKLKNFNPIENLDIDLFLYFFNFLMLKIKRLI